MLKYILRLLPIALCAAFFSGCASVGIYDATETKNIATKEPKKIYVVDFAAPEPAFQVDRKGKDLDAFRKNLSDEITKATVLRLNKAVLPAERAASLASLPRGPAWAVTGRFENVHQGSRVMRVLFGLGLGKTLVQTSVVVYDLSGKRPRAFMNFRTSGGSNREGGIVIPIVTAPFAPPIAILSAVTAIAGPVSSVSLSAAAGSAGLTMDINRTARQITAIVSSTLAKNKFKTLRHKMHPKYKGQPPPWLLPWKNSEPTTANEESH